MIMVEKVVWGSVVHWNLHVSKIHYRTGVLDCISFGSTILINWPLGVCLCHMTVYRLHMCQGLFKTWVSTAKCKGEL